MHANFVSQNLALSGKKKIEPRCKEEPRRRGSCERGGRLHNSKLPQLRTFATDVFFPNLSGTFGNRHGLTQLATALSKRR
jgi:hypothetical protein